MLSDILRISFEFEKNHGFWPNMLYLNTDQLIHWQKEFKEDAAFKEVASRLDMEIVISLDASAPQVAWLPNSCRFLG